MKSTPASAIQQPRLYEMVVDRILKDYVLKAASGDRLQTETEFADLYQVSVPTVREALRSLVQAGYLHRRQGSGTYRKELPSQEKKESAGTAPVALISPLDLADGNISCHYVQLALQTAKCLREFGLSSQIYFGETESDSERSFDDSLLCEDIETGKVSAAVLISESNTGTFRYLESLKQRGVPVLPGGAAFTASGKPHLEAFLENAVGALIRQGRRKIACIGFGADNRPGGRRAFGKIVSSQGGITDDSWMIGDLHPSTSGSGYSLMREIWTTGKIKPDGLVLCDDIFFHDAAVAIRELGIKSPEQLLVVTYHNKGERLHAPFPVIELQYDAKDLARQIAANVSAILQGHPAKELISESRLVDPFLEEIEAMSSGDQTVESEAAGQ